MRRIKIFQNANSSDSNYADFSYFGKSEKVRVMEDFSWPVMKGVGRFSSGGWHVAISWKCKCVLIIRSKRRDRNFHYKFILYVPVVIPTWLSWMMGSEVEIS